MAFCINCGQELADGANFCANCGKSTNEWNSGTERKAKYEGELHKCPNCGENLTSLTAICPACGHEFNSVKVDDDLYKFSQHIDSFDALIANNPKIKSRSGWASWSTGWRIAWIILNIYTFCFPLLFYAIIRFFKRFQFELSPEEKNKATFIENYVFPNEREAIIEALLFIKTKILFLSSKPADRNTLYWSNIWCNKAQTIYNKAAIVLCGDPIAEKAFLEIKDKSKKIAKKCIWKPIIIIGIIAIMILLLCVRCSIKTSIKHNTLLVLPDVAPYSLLPEYEPMYGEIASDNGEKYKISIYQADQTVYKNYVQACIENGFNIDADYKTTSYNAYNKDGYEIILTYNKKGEFSIVINSPMEFYNISWPKNGVAALIPPPPSEVGNISTESASSFTAYIANISKEQFKEYIDICMEYGFNIDYNRYDDSFNAENQEGTDIRISYEGGNVMYVHLYNSNYSYSQIQSNIDEFHKNLNGGETQSTNE